MGTYILRRFLLMFPTLLGVLAVVFFVMAWAPGGFGGVMLGQHGGLSEGQDARRIRQYFMRRYGLDKPAVVQFGRWLNLVSPVGFKTSSQIQFTQEQLDQTRAALEGANWPAGKLNRLIDVTTALAAYENQDPHQTAGEILGLLNDPPTGFVLFNRLGAQVEREFTDRIARLSESDPAEAQREVIDRLAYELAGRDRVLWSRPTLKWPDLGTSLRGTPVTDAIGNALPITLLLNAITIPLVYGIAVVSGVFAARHHGGWFDKSSGLFFLALWSIPTMWAGVMFIGYLANKEYWKLFPTAGLHDSQAEAMAFLPSWGGGGFERGWLLDCAWHLVLPVVCLTYPGFAVLSKLARASVLENLSADFVRTARAKGVAERDVLFRHVLRNSILPLITVAASILPAMLVGSVIVENIFSLPGMGKLAVEAAFMKDRELVMGTTLIGGLIGLVSELFRDLCYAVADPRVSYE